LKKNDELHKYKKYLYEKQEKEDGSKLWAQVPKSVIDTVIQAEIGEKTINGIFDKVDDIIDDKQVDIIVGGPPCQAYSVVGRARIGKAVEDDPRNELYRYYVDFLKKYQPKMFVFENVTGIRSAKNGTVWKDLKDAITNVGYNIGASIFDASNYGVLQYRNRMIIVGWQSLMGQNCFPLLEKEENKNEVLKDLFNDLPERKNGEGQLYVPIKYTKPISEMEYLKNSGIRNDDFDFTTHHIARPHNENDRIIYKLAIDKWIEKRERLNYNTDVPLENQTQNNKESFLNRFQVVDHIGKSHTVVAHIAMDGHYYIYPTLNPTVENVRSITVREAARIQSFPDDYFFEGSRTSAFRQIGNAVPVVLAHKIAEIIKEKLVNGLQ